MATAAMVPYSNPAGNNQMSPQSVVNAATPGAAASPVPLPVQNPLQPGAITQQNPLIPVTAGSVTGAPIAAPTPVNGISEANNILPIVPGGVASNNLDTQLVDVLGQGVGASLFNEINDMSGTDSTALQEFVQSLQPAEAKATANMDASLGAGGVSANSSVAAIGNANLQAQEFGDISKESEDLTLNQEQLTAQILQGLEPGASKEVSTTPLSVFGDVLGSIGSDVGNMVSLNWNV